MKSSNTEWQQGTVTRTEREKLAGHKGVVVWLTGLSGAGKSTLANAVEGCLHRAGCRTYVLDGDNVRHGLCADLGFSDVARAENIRRIGEAAKLFVDAGVIVLAAFISPFHADRARARHLLPAGDFLEVYCACPLEVCEARDVKGLYARARRGEIQQFTGISSPYEVPEDAELVLDTGAMSVDASAAQVLALLREHGVVDAARLPVLRQVPD